jgi:hypothetical protein
MEKNKGVLGRGIDPKILEIAAELGIAVKLDSENPGLFYKGKDGALVKTDVKELFDLN